MLRIPGYDPINQDQIIELVATDKTIVLFGSSGAAMYAKKALEFLNKKPVCFCDNSRERHGKIIDGLIVLSPEQLKSIYPNSKIFICTFRSDYVSEIMLQLKSMGFQDINKIDLLYNVYLMKCSKRFMLSEEISHILDIFHNAKDNTILRFVNVHLTRKCTLNCEKCQALIPYYKNPQHIDKDKIINSVKRLSESFDAIEELFLFGGEAMLHPDFIEICKEVSKFRNILRIFVITNGTITPSEEMLNTFQHYGIDMVCTNYGDLSRQIYVLNTLSNRYNVNLFISDGDKNWFNVSDFSYKDVSEKEKVLYFDNCINNPCPCYTVIEGEFHICGPSAYGTDIGEVKKIVDDYVNLLDDTLNSIKLKEKLHKFLDRTDYIDVCNYCGQHLQECLPAAIQAKGKLQFNNLGGKSLKEEN